MSQKNRCINQFDLIIIERITVMRHNSNLCRSTQTEVLSANFVRTEMALTQLAFSFTWLTFSSICNFIGKTINVHIGTRVNTDYSGFDICYIKWRLYLTEELSFFEKNITCLMRRSCYTRRHKQSHHNSAEIFNHWNYLWISRKVIAIFFVHLKLNNFSSKKAFVWGFCGFFKKSSNIEANMLSYFFFVCKIRRSRTLSSLQVGLISHPCFPCFSWKQQVGKQRFYSMLGVGLALAQLAIVSNSSW